MATYQTTYSNAPAKGLMGQVASEEKSNRISRTVENSDGVKFGAPVQRGTGDHGVVKFTSGKFMGIAILNPAVPPVASGSSLVDGYPQYFTGAFLTQGQMYVVAWGSVADGDPVYYDAAHHAYRATPAATNDQAIPDCFFDTSGVSGDIVEISLKNRSA